MIALSAALVFCAALLAVVWSVDRRRADRCLQARVRDAVIVTLKTGPTFSGVLYDSDPSTLILVRAVEEHTQAPVDGELLLRWSDVAYVQQP